MRGHRISLAAACCLFLNLITGAVSDAHMQKVVWKEAGSGIRDSEIVRVAVSSDNSETVFISSSSSVYRTDNGGRKWNEVLSLRGTGNKIYALATAPGNIIFAGTQEGLYRSDDSGMHWEVIFRGIGDIEDSIYSVSGYPQNSEMIFIGTGSGVYWTDNRGKDWNRGNNMSAGAHVSSISIDKDWPDILYAATAKGLYKSINRGVDWHRVFGNNYPEENGSALTEHNDEETDKIRTGSDIRAVIIDPSDNRYLYVGTSSGLLISEDSGSTWKEAGGSGLLSRDIRHLVINSRHHDSIFAATDRGVFRYSRAQDRWFGIYNGLVCADVAFLAFSSSLQDDSSTLWAACKRGVFKTVLEMKQYPVGLAMNAQQILSTFDNEPGIEEIRNAAIIYAEVQPEKIEGWRKAAVKKALLPDLRFEYQKNRDWQKGTYFYSNSTEKYKDDDITVDRDVDWSITLTWKLGELIWNSDQTSIDTRSRLMVQLRDDVLNEVTRLYFERRKLQIEILLSPPEDFKERIEKELRLQELTADIDALTGSYLSKILAQIR